MMLSVNAEEAFPSSMKNACSSGQDIHKYSKIKTKTPFLYANYANREYMLKFKLNIN